MLTPKQERVELLNWMRKVMEDLDARSEGYPAADPAALYAEGQPVLRRLEQEPER